MSAVVQLRKFDFNLVYVAKESPQENTLTGSLLALDEDDALDRLEATYEQLATRLKSIRVQAQYCDKYDPPRSFSRYIQPKATTPPVPEKPKFQLQDVEGLTEHFDYFEVEVKPFTYKEKSE